MTDLEMTKLCAEAMELDPSKESIPGSGSVIVARGSWLYRPLHDDAQAMALVKKLRLVIDLPDGENGEWLVYPMTTGNPDRAALGLDLNRAIVECVAKMQIAAVLDYSK